MRLGLFGGTFDPIHFGHLAVAAEARRAAALDRVLFLPALQSPLREPPLATAEARLRMCELALADQPEFAVSDVEVRRPPPSYTVDTILAIRRQRPDDSLVVVMGADALREVPSWRDFGRILREAEIIALTRPDHPGSLPEELVAAVPSAPDRIDIRTMPPVDISASSIRAMIVDGREIGAYVPAAVADYIRRHRLYAPAPSVKTGSI